jgi:magnesium transporter
MAMEVIDGAALQADRTPPAAAVCVLVPPSAPERVVAAAVWLGADATTAQHALASPQRRPLAHADDGRISVIAFAISDADAVLEVHLHVGTRGLLVVCPQPVMPALSEVVSRVDGGPDDALIAVLLWIASDSTATVERLADEVVRLDQTRVGLASGAVRRTISQLRHQLFALQQLWTAHHLVCAPDGVVADALDRTLAEVGRRRLGYAGVIFEASSAAAAQLYALLGDTLSRQSAVINERLTLVTVIFLPLTVSSGFFGMNFNWMTDHIGSAAAFVVLGMVLPLGLVAVTVFAARRVSGE